MSSDLMPRKRWNAFRTSYRRVKIRLWPNFVHAISLRRGKLNSIEYKAMAKLVGLPTLQTPASDCRPGIVSVLKPGFYRKPSWPRPPLRTWFRKDRREMGWVPTVSFDKAVKKTVHWYIENKLGIRCYFSGVSETCIFLRSPILIIVWDQLLTESGLRPHTASGLAP